MKHLEKLIKIGLPKSGVFYIGHTEPEVGSNMDKNHNNYVYSVFVSRDGEKYKEFEFNSSINDYNNGIDSLSNEDLIYALKYFAGDALDSQNSYEDFCHEFGYDKDIYSARIYSGCENTYEKLGSLGLYDDDELCDLVNEFVDWENDELSIDEFLKEVHENKEIPFEENDSNKSYNPDYYNISWGEFDIDSYENLTANAFVNDLEQNIEPLKELKLTIEALANDDELLLNLQELEDNVELLKKYSFGKANFSINETVDTLSQRIQDDMANENSTASSINEIKEALKNTELFLSNEFDIDLNDSDDTIQEAIYEKKEAFDPMTNGAWITSMDAEPEDIEKILEHASNVSVLQFYEKETNPNSNRIYKEAECAITLNGAGMDFSQAIAYAYLVIDEKIPERIMNQHNINDEAFSVSEAGLAEIKEYLVKKYESKEEQAVESLSSLNVENTDDNTNAQRQ